MVTIQNARIQSASFRPRTEKVDTLVLHFTALDLEASLRVLRYGEVSSHYVLAEDGTVYQILEDCEVGWHAGLSMWRGKTGVNGRSIGIEIVNLDGNTRDYPTAQIEALIDLCTVIIARNPGISHRNVVGHSDIAPKRKDDPGVKFPWKELAEAGIGLWPSGAQSEVVAAQPQIQSFLEACGYPKEHAYGTRDGAYVYVFDSANPPVGVSNVVCVTTKDILRAFQLRFQPDNATGIALPSTMGLLRRLAAM
ncbi:MAG TPA: N-acetylmuramoyl-L-alanine amidase [Desulfobulbaceae bacterium]|nr:N-acetylmuramoyl-L-alanine amidase [Desulfobulbaceae bacterium]